MLYYVAPGADAGAIRWRYGGASEVTVDAQTGQLIIALRPPGSGGQRVTLTEDAGPVEFAVGSHIRGALLQKSGLIKNSVNTAGQIIVEWFDQSRIDPAILKPGQFSLHHTCVVHQSRPNASDARRIGIALSYIPTHTRYIGRRRMPAALVRGEDAHGHFDLQPAPVEDFGAAETERHDVTFRAYIDSFYEQLGEAEKDLPEEAAAGLVY